MKNLALARLVQWTPQSSAEEVDRIYTSAELGLEMERLKQGSAWLVLGRKGVGKSALIYKFLDTNKETILARKREFDPVLIHERLRLFGADARASAHKAFKLDILLLAAYELQLDLPDGGIRRAARRIARYYDGKWMTGFLANLRRSKLLGRVSKAFLGDEDIGNAAPQLFSDPALIDKELLRVEGQMRELCSRLKTKKPIYIIFDEVDLTLTRLRSAGAPRYSSYIEDLAALLQACSSFGDLRALGIPIYPVVVLRDDIFEEATRGGADRGKWRQSAIEVSFTSKEIEALLQYRLVSELQKAGVKGVRADTPLLKVWSHYSDNAQCAPTKKTILQLVLQRTFNRPRDVVLFMQVLATAVARRNGAAKIAPTDFERARPPYAKYFWNEFLDELGYKYPFLSMIEQSLYEVFYPEVRPGVTSYRTGAKATLLREKFAALRSNLERDGVNIGSEDHLISNLLASSIIGVQISIAGTSRIAFRYIDGVERVFSWNDVYYLHGAVADYFYVRSGRDPERSPLDIDVLNPAA